ncbi:type-2 ice-structuring protein-like [Haliotis rubra]|uniref:type-2 ice-structuring protein-like n=1 Tax=Haliotis rubra TaxID=36100 RepID=UPI001EE57CFE|nr:type-2 ice-structuring protein-like [Haliotis rubra]
MIGLTILVSFCLQYTYSHTVVRHFTRAEELDDRVGNNWIRELAYDTFVDCAGLCFQNKTCHSFSFYSGACYIRNTYDVHTDILYLGSPGMKTFLKKAECVSPYSQIGDICIWVSSSALANEASRSKCQMDGGDLVTLPTLDKIQLVEDFMEANGFKVNTRRSVGAYLDVASLKWNWLDGSALNSSNWCDPNNLIQTSEICLQMGNSFCWMDRPCTYPHEYICEIRL